MLTSILVAINVQSGCASCAKALHKLCKPSAQSVQRLCTNLVLVKGFIDYRIKEKRKDITLMPDNFIHIELITRSS